MADGFHVLLSRFFSEEAYQVTADVNSLLGSGALPVSVP